LKSKVSKPTVSKPEWGVPTPKTQGDIYIAFECATSEYPTPQSCFDAMQKSFEQSGCGLSENDCDKLPLIRTSERIFCRGFLQGCYRTMTKVCVNGFQKAEFKKPPMVFMTPNGIYCRDTAPKAKPSSI
jgi:hypothetical protein